MYSKKLLLVLVSILLLVTVVGCGGTGQTDTATSTVTDSLDTIIENGVVRVAIPQDTPLFGTQATDGSYTGYDVDIANMIATELGVEVELVPVTSQNRIPYLTSGKVDLVIANMGVKAERALVINFSQPYAPFFWAVYGSKDLAIPSIEDTVGYTVGATMGTLEEIAFSDAAPEGVEIMRYADQATTVEAFLSGQVDLLVGSNAVAADIIANNPDMKVESKFVLQQSPCHIGVRQADTKLLNWVDAFIFTHKLDGSLDDLSVKYFGEPLPDFPSL